MRHALIAGIVQADRLQHSVGVLGGAVAQGGVKLQRFSRGQASAEGEVVRHIPDLLQVFDALLLPGQAVELDRASSGAEDADQHAQDRAFARAVSAAQSDDFARLDAQAERMDNRFVVDRFAYLIDGKSEALHGVTSFPMPG